VMGAGTLISRILGFLRDILIANFFGTSAVLEAFLVSFRLPNIFRSIFAEGFSDSVAVPVLSEYQRDRKSLFRISGHLFTLSLLVLTLFTLAGILGAKFLVTVIAPGFLDDSFKFNLAVSFTRITFIYLFLIGLSSSLISTLYSLKRFFVVSITPVFLNITFIAGIPFFAGSLENYILVICVVVAGVLQLIFPLIFLLREGFSFNFNLRSSLKDSVVIKMFKLFVPRIWSSIVYHLQVFIDTIYSSFSFIVGQGALASVYYANRLIQLPFALIALSISRVVVVDLSSYGSEGDMENFKKLFVFSFQNILFFIIPVAVFFLFVPDAVIEVIYRRGEFDPYSLNMTSSVLFFYAFGLLFFCGIKLLVSSFYSLKDTSTPAKTATLSLIVNAILSAILMFPLKIGGVALGSSLAAGFNFVLLYYKLKKKIGSLDWGDTLTQFFKIVFLSILTGGLARFLWFHLPFNKYIRILLMVSFITVFFITSGYFFKFKQIDYFIRWISRKK
ncbi:MAG: murein biosynthesis integral membrane protein MurJ, partial [Candidatus Omnitrophica bacterium]|nr:murein biosynthesis integral membrane protein MurJ [Candidatus Omnitrophota bacterium]MBD3269118.1 murein biosynthesis integral membrane protein MurJ [Candidatus Omnitrophota bacterium]